MWGMSTSDPNHLIKITILLIFKTNMNAYLSVRTAVSALSVILISACGGSGPDPVTGVTATDLRYTGITTAVTLNLSGNALDNSIKVYANDNACMVNPAITASARTALCLLTLPSSLKLPVRVTSASDYPLYNTTLDIPTPQVTFQTSLGDFVMELNPTAAPITVKNFLSYVNKSPSFYNGTIFHRVISGFMVQGGGYTSGMATKSGLSTAITLENTQTTGLRNTRATIAMARTSLANSATSQFFVNLVDNGFLNYSSDSAPGYAVFGKVISGMDVIDLMATQPIQSSGDNVPVTDITVTSASQTQ